LVFRISFRFVFRLVFLYFFDFLDFFLIFKNSATGERINLRDFLYFLLLGFNKAGREGRDLIFI
jgi:hypothetical protein